MIIQTEITDYWGFFNGAAPTHDDVDEFFTQANHREMFNEPYGDGFQDPELVVLRRVAHRMITERSLAPSDPERETYYRRETARNV